MDKRTIKKRRREYTRQFYRGNGGNILLALGWILLSNGANLMISWLMQVMVDACNGSTAYRFWELLLLCVLDAALFLLGSVLSYIAFPRMISRAMSQYKNFLFQKLTKKNISAFSGENTSLYISALTNDTNTIEVDFLCNLFNGLMDVVSLVGALALMLYYSPMLTCFSILLALLPVVASVFAGNRVAEAEKVVSIKNEGYVATVKDCLSGFSVMKSFRAEDALCRMFAQQEQRVHDAKIVRRRASISINSLGMIAGLVSQLGVFLIGIWMLQYGFGISAGILMAYVNLMGQLVYPIRTVPQYYAGWKAANALVDRVAEALDANVREEGDPIEPVLSQGIQVKAVTFGYGEEPVLKGVDADFEAGKSYAIVGASGSGKSTLLNLLMASYDGYSGSILYDGKDLRTIRSESVYELASMVQQNVFVFNASIRENVTMFRQFPEEEVERAMGLSGLTALVQERGEGYLCGENGCNLSGGEKQRISIARSLLRKSSLLLVDEATAALDAQTAWQVSNAILNLQGLTRIVVTHALDENLLKQYDGILAMKAGKIVERGSFADLMEKKGYFYSLYTVSQ